MSEPIITSTALPAADGAACAQRQPRSVAHLLFAFTLLALQGFGGVLAIMQRDLVERKGWMTDEEFVEDWAAAQILPGPNVINLSVMIGARHFGLAGALAALAGMLTAPLVVVLLLALAYARFATLPGVAGALGGMGAVTAGLIGATALRLTSVLRVHPLGRTACAVIAGCGFVAVALLQWPLAWVLLGVGVPSCALVYFRLAP